MMFGSIIIECWIDKMAGFCYNMTIEDCCMLLIKKGERKMKHKKLYVVLTLVCFLLTLIPVSAFAKSEPSLSDRITSMDGSQTVEMDNTVSFDLMLDEVYGYDESTTALYL